MTALGITPEPPRAEIPAELVEAILEGGTPVDRWAVAALLESRGVRDVDARRYGRRDVFELAEDVTDQAMSRLDAPSSPAVDRPWRPRVARFGRTYVKGGFSFVPLAIQLTSLLVLGYSQWASLTFSVLQASTIALVIMLSFIVTAGTVQALGYLGSAFQASGKHMLAERAVYGLLAAGLVFALAFGGLLGAVNAITGAVEWSRFGIAAVYYVLMSAMWLSTAVLYMLRRYLGMVASTLVGVAVVGLSHDAAGFGLYLSHWLGIVATIAVTLGWAGLILRRQARDTRGTLRLAKMPRRSALARQIVPHFLYGTLYFGFLFVDRLIAWSVGGNPFPIWFRTPYELGLDWAFVTVVFGMALLEHIVTDYPRMSASLQERSSALGIRSHNRAHLRYWHRHVGVVALLMGGGALAGYWAIPALSRLGPFAELRTGIADPLTRSIFVWGLVGYALLACALTNAVFLLGLARPWSVVRALTLAVAVDAVTGGVLSRTGPYWHGVIGLAAGAAVFFVVTAWAVVRALREADYAYYSSF